MYKILTLEIVSMAVNYHAILIIFATVEKVGPKKKFDLNFQCDVTSFLNIASSNI